MDIPKETDGAVQRWVMIYGQASPYLIPPSYIPAEETSGKEPAMLWVKHEDCLIIERLLADRIVDNQALRALVRQLKIERRGLELSIEEHDREREVLCERIVQLRDGTGLPFSWPS